MTSKADFTSEEWWRLSEAPLAIAMYVSGADMRTGPVGTIKELSAPLKAAGKERDTATAGSLLAELLSTWANKLSEDSKKADSESDSGETAGAAKVDLLGFITGVGKLLDEKASPDEAKAVKQWLVSAARMSAEAGKEGGFLGIGGEKVSEAETKAIAEIEQALGVAA